MKKQIRVPFQALAAVLVLALPLVVGVVTAQEKPAEKPAAAAAGPQLTVEQKQAIQLAAKDIEIAQLRAAQAAADYNAARDRVNKLLAAYVPAGYQIDDQLNLVKSPEPAKKDPPKDPK